MNPRTSTPMETLLLHEMAHAVTPGGHGKKWQSEMRRLLRRGAPVKGELDLYLRSARPVGKRMMLGEFEDAGAEGVPWADVRLGLGYQYSLVDKNGIPPDESSRRDLRKAYYAWRKGRLFREKYPVPDKSRLLKAL